MRIISTAAVSLILLATPLISSALTQDEIRAQTQALLLQVQQLQAQLAAQQGTTVNQTTTNTSVTTSANSSALCPAIGRTLKRNSTGDDVTRLQKFLAQDSAIYPEGTISTFFGGLTEKAVQRWQAKFKIVSTGTPDSTGYGVVGPRTAAAIAIVCGGGTYNGVSGTANMTSPVGGFIQVSPISGSAPLQVSIQTTVNTTNSCAAATYLLDFGDGTSPQSLPTQAGICQPQTLTVPHTYQFAGTFKVTLSAGGHQTNATVVVGAAATPTQTPASSGNVSVSITDNLFTQKNITIAPGTKVTWTNNGAMSHNVTADNSSFTSGTLAPGQNYSTTFTLAGSYPYYCSFHGAAGGVGMSGTVTVSNSASNPSPNPTPAATTFGPVAVSPGAGGNPLGVSVQFDTTGCTTYTVNWGDSTSNASGNCGSSVNQSHTYSQGGSYTIQVTRGTQTDSAGVVISQ